MGKKYFTDEQVMELKLNSNIANVTNKAITYTEKFRENFYEELSNGKGPTQIFRENGFDTKVIGQKRISNFTERVKKQALRPERFSDTRSRNSGRKQSQERTLEEEIAYLKHKVAFQNQQIEALKKMKQVEREAYWKRLRLQKKNSK